MLTFDKPVSSCFSAKTQAVYRLIFAAVSIMCVYLVKMSMYIVVMDDGQLELTAGSLKAQTHT